MAEITQVRWSGLGGQGVVLAGVLLGQAGVIEGKYISVSNSYGAQARGSACKSEIVFSDGPIDFPHLLTADILVAMSQTAYNLYCEEVRKDRGFIFYDEGLATPQDDLPVKHIGIRATESAVERFKDSQVANLILLGALVAASRIVSPEATRKAIRMHVNKRFHALDLRALSLGMQLGRRSNG